MFFKDVASLDGLIFCHMVQSSSVIATDGIPIKYNGKSRKFPALRENQEMVSRLRCHTRNVWNRHQTTRKLSLFPGYCNATGNGKLFRDVLKKLVHVNEHVVFCTVMSHAYN